MWLSELRGRPARHYSSCHLTGPWRAPHLAEAHFSACPAGVLVTTSWLTPRSPWQQCKMGSAHMTSLSPAMVSLCVGRARWMVRRGAFGWSPSHSPPALCTSSLPEEHPAWLPLYGSVCCRLVAQPLCMTQPTASGSLRVQVRAPEEWKGARRRQRRAGSPGN